MVAVSYGHKVNETEI